MKRREFMGLTGGALASATWPLGAHAQQDGRVPRVVFWTGGAFPDDPIGQRNMIALRDALRGFGWIDSRNVQVDARWAPVTFAGEELRAAAAGLAAEKPDVIVTTGAPILGALHRQTKAVPIVFTMVTDPVRDGFVASLARPGGNITGFTIFEHSFAGKWLEMLKDAVPSMTRLAVMQNPDHPAWNAYLGAITAIAPGLGVEVTPTPVTSIPDIEPALAAFARAPNGGLVVLPSQVGTQHGAVIADAALRHRLPSTYSLRSFPAAGGLMSYGVVQVEAIRQAATYVDRILKGAKPGELPVQAATKFEMVFNLKTAKALGITVPPTMLGRADEVIE